MKKKCVFVGFLAIFVSVLNACGAVLPAESVVAKELEIIVLKDELAVPMPMAVVPEVEHTVNKKEIVSEEHRIEDTLKDVEQDTYVVMSSEYVQEEVADGRVDDSDFVADIKGTQVKLDEEINHLMNTLGEPDSFTETVSNPRIGSDKEYIYSGITIRTKPENGRDIVKCIEYRGDEKTLSGIGVGSTRADIEAAYGIEYAIDPDYIIYTYSSNATISFKMNGEECESILFSRQ